jgi:hypothetical protein
MQPSLFTRISTMAEVDDRLASGRASFEDWLDCVQVCQRDQQWPTAERCAQLALEAALRRPLAKVKLVEAARAVVSGALPRSLNGPDWLTTGAGGLSRARDMLRSRRAGATHRSLIEALDEVLADLDQMILLITDDQAVSRIKLASLLRRYERPDLAISLADRVLAIAAANHVALTVRAAARMDLGETGAVNDAERAFQVGDSVHSLAALVRGLRLAGRLDDAVTLALELVERDPSPASASLLAAAAHEASDASALEQAQELLERLGDRWVGREGADRHVRLLAAKQLRRDGQLEEAHAALVALLGQRSWRTAQELLDVVQRDLELRDAAVDQASL